jgi:hypothetical protein
LGTLPNSGPGEGSLLNYGVAEIPGPNETGPLRRLVRSAGSSQSARRSESQKQGAEEGD